MFPFQSQSSLPKCDPQTTLQWFHSFLLLGQPPKMKEREASGPFATETAGTLSFRLAGTQTTGGGSLFACNVGCSPFVKASARGELEPF